MVNQELLVHLARRVLLELKVLPVYLVDQDFKEPLDRQAHKEMLVVKVQRALLDLADFLDNRVRQELQAQLARLVFRDFLVLLELLDRTERLAHLVPRASQA